MAPSCPSSSASLSLIPSIPVRTRLGRTKQQRVTGQEPAAVCSATQTEQTHYGASRVCPWGRSFSRPLPGASEGWGLEGHSAVSEVCTALNVTGRRYFARGPRQTAVEQKYCLKDQFPELISISKGVYLEEREFEPPRASENKDQ